MASKQELQIQQKREVEKREEATDPSWVFLPTTDIYETQDALNVVMEMPGMEKTTSTWPSRPLAGKSVLIIEDEALIAMSVESCLQDAGAAVVIANSRGGGARPDAQAAQS